MTPFPSVLQLRPECSRAPRWQTSYPRLFVGLAAVLVVLLLALLVLPNLVRPRIVESRWDCISNLRQMDGALSQYALEHRLTNGAKVEPDRLLPYYSSSNQFHLFTKCLAGGEYPAVLTVGVEPTCSLFSTNPELHTAKWEESWQKRRKELNRWW